MHLPLKDNNLRIIHLPRTFFFSTSPDFIPSRLHSVTESPVPDNPSRQLAVAAMPYSSLVCLRVLSQSSALIPFHLANQNTPSE